MTKELKISRVEKNNVDSSEVHELLDKNTFRGTASIATTGQIAILISRRLLFA